MKKKKIIVERRQFEERRARVKWPGILSRTSRGRGVAVFVYYRATARTSANVQSIRRARGTVLLIAAIRNNIVIVYYYYYYYIL